MDPTTGQGGSLAHVSEGNSCTFNVTKGRGKPSAIALQKCSGSSVLKDMSKEIARYQE